MLARLLTPGKQRHVSCDQGTLDVRVDVEREKGFALPLVSLTERALSTSNLHSDPLLMSFHVRLRKTGLLLRQEK